jgi:hypothetical protein
MRALDTFAQNDIVAPSASAQRRRPPGCEPGRSGNVAATLTVIVALLGALTGGCKRKQAPATGDQLVVATVGERTITQGEVRKRLRDQPPAMRARYQNLELRKQFIQSLAEHELLVQEAHRRGHGQPGTRSAQADAQALQALVAELTVRSAKPATPPPALGDTGAAPAQARAFTELQQLLESLRPRVTLHEGAIQSMDLSTPDMPPAR